MKTDLHVKAIIGFSCLLVLPVGYVPCGAQEATKPASAFHDDVEFLKKHTQIVLLRRGDAAVALAPAYQGRVMTSTFDQSVGPSFGWINRPVIQQGFLPDEKRTGKLEEHIYIFGGEERFWLGPEGSQFSVFFKPGTNFEFNDWTTPAAVDTDAWQLAKKSETSATFTHQCELVNYSGTHFNIGIQRTITLLGDDEVVRLTGKRLPAGLRLVGYETDNRVTNRGNNAWKPETGLISIWLLGMYNPSPETTVVIPFIAGDESQLGTKVNDTYFGKVPPEHLKIEDDAVFFRGNGTRRGKIGVGPRRTKGLAGSYDAGGGVLTVVTYNKQPAVHGYVNSMWGFQKEPYAGDVINAYNDGPPGPGKPPLGPFYELETSSPAAALAPGQTMKHIQQTWHFQGDEATLEPIARQLLSVGILEIQNKF